ncbi:hypothetical protein F7Q99_37575 [Streptomyces kaniharaensis]|uniref:DUF6542 domain-containing protein n=1 Tax=Streptomyces kaniharaensis TaxID=212423 RepID=A0A6N7L1V2_9ACTN|nr:DUF6542 domain-containing protein [Streptomyces kaniharaensis]MQS17750.1 hypothetical protein [Streptomyces kaniharaensis]
MAGQRARTPYQEAGPRPAEPAAPAQRSSADAGEPVAARGMRARRVGAASRRRQQAQRRSGVPTVLAAVGLPVLGAVADELGGPGVGRYFAIAAVLGTALAAALCGRAGRWWVVTAAPLVVLVTAAGTEYLWNGDKYQGRKLGTGALRWVVGAFPVMAAAVGAALLVVVVKAVLDRRGLPESRADRGGTTDRRSRRG